MIKRPQLGPPLALALFAVTIFAWWNHNNSAQAHVRADEAATQATDGSYADDVESAECPDDCPGQEAGWAWARRHRVSAAGQCPNAPGQAFDEGCQAYAGAYEDAHEDALGDD